MIGLSTVWTSATSSSGRALLATILDIGFDAVELEYRITINVFRELLPCLFAHRIKVLSLHNYVPLPETIPRDQASADFFPLSSLDKETRKEGIDCTLKTLETAHSLEVPVIVVHLGCVETDLPRTGLQTLFRTDAWGDEGAALLEKEREERQRHAARHLDCVLSSLDKILRRAEDLQVTVGIENRYYYQEIPSFEEIDHILQIFEGAPIGYWHDTGHAAVQETLAIVSQQDLLERFGPRMVGIHLHDARGVADHLPPGQGDIDMALVARHLPDTAVRILEIHPPATGDEILAGLQHLAHHRIS